MFIPPGSQTIAFIKGYEERGLKQAGIRIIATGDLTDDGVLQAMGEPTLGLITSFHYSAAHDSPENKAFLKAYVGDERHQAAPELHGMRRLRRHGGDRRGAEEDRRLRRPRQVRRGAQGNALTSPRGPIMIDPETRDIVQTVYIRRVEKVDGLLYNIEFDKYPDVKDPGKQ